MGRRKKPGFRQMKMLASRVELSDYYKFESLIKLEGKKLQEVVNLFVINYISGTIKIQDDEFITKNEKDEQDV